MRQLLRTSLRYWSCHWPRWTAVINSSRSAKARLATVVRRRTDQMPALVEVGCVGRQLEDSEPVTVVGVAAHAGGEVGVEVVADQHDRAAELVGGRSGSGRGSPSMRSFCAHRAGRPGRVGRSVVEILRPCSRPGRPPIRGGGSGPARGPQVCGRSGTRCGWSAVSSRIQLCP